MSCQLPGRYHIFMASPPRAMMVIINADDLGTNEATNQAIFDLMDQGLVTSATLIANAPAFHQAVERLSGYPQCSFGIHLNATVFKPLNPTPDLAPLLDAQGDLSQQFWNIRLSPRLVRAIHTELRAQVQRILDAGVRVSHFDSHQHIHISPPLFSVIKSLQREFGVRRVRNTINLIAFGQSMRLGRRSRKALFSLALRRWFATRTSYAFCAFSDFYSWIEAGRLPECQSLEAMVHPGASSPLYVEEINQLRSGWREKMGASVRLATYRDL